MYFSRSHDTAWNVNYRGKRCLRVPNLKKVQKSVLARILMSSHYILNFEKLFAAAGGSARTHHTHIHTLTRRWLRQSTIWLLSGYILAGLHALTLAPRAACMNGRAKLLSPHGRIRPNYNRVVRRSQRWQQTA